MSCSVGCRLGLDPMLLWLWCRPAATAPIRPLAWEPPYATGVAIEKAKRQKKRKFTRVIHHTKYWTPKGKLQCNRNCVKNYNPQNLENNSVAETAEIMAAEGDKWHSEMQKSQVLSTLVQAQRSHLQSLRFRSLFSANFIPYKALLFPCKQPEPPPFLSRHCYCLKKTEQGYRSETDKQCLEQD